MQLTVVADSRSGMVYHCATSCAQQWWPEKKGFASGVVLSMLGASTLVFTPVINALIADDPTRVPFSFRVLGIAFSILLIMTYYFMRLPESPGDGKMLRDIAGKKTAVIEI